MKPDRGLALFLLFSGFVLAGNDGPCPDLKAPQNREIASQALDRFRLYECADMTLADALKVKPVSPLAERLYKYTCNVAGSNPSLDKVLDALNRRKKSAANPKSLEADLTRSSAAGDPSSPVTLVGYVCSRCPLCKFMTLLLHKEVTEGTLKGRVKFYFRPFPIKSHAHSAEGALAVQAAAQFGKPWEYLLLLYRNFDSFSVDKLPAWAADSLGINRKDFSAAMNSGPVNNSVVESKKEGFKNGVAETPTFFIDGRRYEGFMNYQSLFDVLNEEYDRVTGRLCAE
jgi:protein-disulfide isomerase